MPRPTKEQEHEEGGMLRSAAGKVMWVGRATVFLVGLAVVLALAVGAASSAFAANGQNLIIGKGLADTVNNIATLPTKLTMKGTAGGPALQVTQQGTNAGASGVGVTVPSGKAPLTVNSTAGTAKNLSADKLDGKDSSAFAQSMGAAVKTSSGGATLLRAKGATAVSASDGTYTVTFKQPVSNCIHVATVSPDPDYVGSGGFYGHSGGIQVYRTSTTPTNQVLVTPYEPGFGRTYAGFQLLVTC